MTFADELFIFIRENKFNWIKKLEQNPELLAKVNECSEQICGSIPLTMQEKVFAIKTNSSPLCNKGRRRHITNVINDIDWISCAKDVKICACFAALKSLGGKRAREKQPLETIMISNSTREFESEFIKLHDGENKNIPRTLECNRELAKWILERARATHPHLTEDCLEEGRYIVCANLGLCGVRMPPPCPHGHQFKFRQFWNGYKYCKPHCSCANKNQSEKMISHHQNLSSEERQRRVDAAEKTFLENYNTTNPMKNKELVQKIREKRIEEGLAPSPFENPTILEKAKATLMENYGVEFAFQSKQIREKAKQSFETNHPNEPDPMSIARRAFTQQTGFSNPGQMPEIKEKIEKSMLDRHGVRRALQSPIILKTMQDKLNDKHGVNNVMKIKSVHQHHMDVMFKLYNRNNSSQIQIPDWSWEILQSEDQFKALTRQLSVAGCAKKLDVSYSTIQRTYVRYGIELPKSSYETQVLAILAKYNVTNVIKNTRSILPSGLELDIVLPDSKLAIEVCGLYWHSSAQERHQANPNYHLDKLNEAKSLGYHLITVFDDELFYKPEIVEQRIVHALGLSPKGVGARKLVVRSITAQQEKSFLEQFHMQGLGAYGFCKLGAFHNNELVAVMTFAKGRPFLNQDPNVIELLRFATNGKTYPGVASKLFSTFTKLYPHINEVISFADRRWSQDGGVYKQMNFNLEHETKPNFSYVDLNRFMRFNRFKYNRQRVLNLYPEYSHLPTDWIIENILNLYKVYDCGSYKFKWMR